MSYTALTTASAIQTYYANISFSTATKPTAAAVSAWINEATSLVYSAIADRYAIPITNTDDLLVLKPIAEKYVVANINFVLGKNTNSVVDGRVLQPRGISYKDFYDSLDKLKSGDILLPNSAGSSKVSFNSYTSVSTGAYRVAAKETVQW